MDDQTETQYLRSLFDDDKATEIFRFVGHQINVVDNIGSSLVSLAGIVLVLTAALVPQATSLPEVIRVPILAGAILVLVAAGVAALGVFRLEWISQKIEVGDSGRTISNAIRIRNRKNSRLNLAILCLFAGLVGYVVGILFYLMG